MQAVLLGAFEGDAGAVHLGEAEGVVRLDAEHLLDAPPVLVGMRLGADHQRVQLRVLARIEAFFPEHVVQTPEIARDRVRDGRAEVAHQLDLAQAVAGAGGNAQATELLDAVLEAQPAGEQAVAADVLEDVGVAHAGGEQRARHQVRPAREVVPVVIDHRRVAGRAARTVQADDIALVGGEKAPRIIATQVLLGGEGQLADRVDRLQTVRRRSTEHGLLAIVGRGDRLPQGVVQTLDLERRQILALDFFEFFFPEHKPSIKIGFRQWEPSINPVSGPGRAVFA